MLQWLVSPQKYAIVSTVLGVLFAWSTLCFALNSRPRSVCCLLTKLHESHFFTCMSVLFKNCFHFCVLSHCSLHAVPGSVLWVLSPQPHAGCCCPESGSGPELSGARAHSDRALCRHTARATEDPRRLRVGPGREACSEQQSQKDAQVLQVPERCGREGPGQRGKLWLCGKNVL